MNRYSLHISNLKEFYTELKNANMLIISLIAPSITSKGTLIVVPLGLAFT